ncbi:MAG: hypothetical protein CM1200mP34_5690 [Verrucomicrobiales bacterium]|nr:MAG: hypothetical protein CM1200mP34_5690 [Verrucomicrobiales bacterium]
MCGAHVADPVRVAVVFGVATLVTVSPRPRRSRQTPLSTLYQFPGRAVYAGSALHPPVVGINDHIKRLVDVTGWPKEQGGHRHVARGV